MKLLRPRALCPASIAVSFVAIGCGSSPREADGTSQSAVTVCAGPSIVHGMDVSHYDGTIDWPTAKGSGIDFAVVKATEDLTYVDPTFATNWAGMKSAGVVRGAYHFFHADTDPVAQATHFVQTVGALETGDLPLVLDLETTNGQTGATIAAHAITFLQTVSAMTGLTAIVYTSPGFVGGLSNTQGLAPYTLWVANWGVSCPDVPSPWTSWAFWQSSSTGTVPGVPASAVDLDEFDGTLAQLMGLGQGSGGDAGTSDAGKSDAAGRDAGGGGDGSVTPLPDGGQVLDAGPGNGNPDGGGGIELLPPAASSSGCNAAPATGGFGGMGFAVVAVVGSWARRRRRVT